MERTTYKNIQNMLLLFTIIVIIAAFYIENIYALQPCPLCLMQRFCVFVIGFLYFIGFGLKSMHKGRNLAFIQMVFSILGLYFASRQILLQSLPVNEAEICMPGLDALVRYFSFSTILKAFFWGSSSCSEVLWRGFGISMPVWAFIYFSLSLVANTILAILLSLTNRKK